MPIENPQMAKESDQLRAKLVWLWMIFILLFLLNLSVPQTIATSEAFIKVTKFQVPAQARVGDTFRLACYYELSKEQRLYAMKMFKDGNEFYRYLPSGENARQTFRVDGLTYLELIPSKPLEILVRNVDLRTAGRYRCMITVEGTFKSISQERDLKVVNRTSSMQLNPSMTDAGLQIVGGGSSMNGVLTNRQQQQRHAVHMRKQQQQQKFAAPRGQTQSSPPVASLQQEVQQQRSSAGGSQIINCSLGNQLVVYMSALMVTLWVLSGTYGAYTITDYDTGWLAVGELS